ncbi:MAG: hypothetical protein HQL56_05930 [Magnetococcales bacterium]|nr:hypothetical protein [Magnetococcales bacterium]
MTADEEVRQVLQVVEANIREERHPYLYTTMSNSGDTCEENLEAYEEAMSMTAQILKEALTD